MFKLISRFFKTKRYDDPLHDIKELLGAQYNVQFVDVRMAPVYYGLGGLKKVYTKIIIPNSELSKKSFTMVGAEHRYFSCEISKQEYDMHSAIDYDRAVNS